MGLLFVEHFIDHGLVKDFPQHHLPPGAWGELLNARISTGAVEKVDGDEAMFSSLPISPEFVMEWVNLGISHFFIGDKTKLYKVDTSGTTDVTRSSGDYNGVSGSYWTGVVFGGVPIVNLSDSNEPPQSWDGSTRFQNLPNWPAGTYCKVFRTFKQFCIAMNLVRGSGTYPTQVMWSDTADPGTVPTTWTPAANNLAGDYSFSATPGAVLDGMALGNAFFVYKEDSAYIMQVSSDTFVFSTTEAFRTLGILATGCVTEFERKHFVVTAGDVVVHDGVHVRSIIDDLNRKYLFSQIDTEYSDRVRVVADRDNGEIWVAYPTPGSSGKLTAALVWNWRTKLWTRRELPGALSFTEGRATSSSGSPIIDNTLEIINTANWPPDTGESSATNVRVVYGTGEVGNALAVTGQGWRRLGSSYQFYMERIGLPLFVMRRDGKERVEPGLVKIITEAYPLIEAANGTVVKFRFGTQMRVNDPIAWGDVLEFTVGQDKKLDLVLSFCHLSVRILVDADTAVKVYGLEFDGMITGRY